MILFINDPLFVCHELEYFQRPKYYRHSLQIVAEINKTDEGKNKLLHLAFGFWLKIISDVAGYGKKCYNF